MVNNYINDLLNLIKLEKEENMKKFKEEIFHMDSNLREKKGRALNNMNGSLISKDKTGYVFKFKKNEKLETDMEVEDYVIIFPQNIFDNFVEGIIIEKRNNSILIKILYDEYGIKIPNWLFEKVMIHLSLNNTTYSRMEKNLNNLSKMGIQALKFGLKQEKPKIINAIKTINFFDNQLNENQKVAISNSISSEDFYLIHGPFGTGKTKTLIELILQENKIHNKIIVTAESNTAVDNITKRLLSEKNINITRLGNLNHISSLVHDYTLNKKILKHNLQTKIKKTKDNIKKLSNLQDQFIEPTSVVLSQFSEDDIISHAKNNAEIMEFSLDETKSMSDWIKYQRQINALYEYVRKLKNEIKQEIINESDVILSTNSSAALDVIQNIEFDVAIIDEASQATIPSILIPISKSKRFILAGDHKQLPPTVLNKNIKTELEDTLFEKLINNFSYQSSFLDIQYRMNKSLMKLPNELFYENKLRCSENNAYNNLGYVRKNYDNINPLIFIDTSNLDDNYESKENNSYKNICEYNIVLKIIKEYLDVGINESNIGIISPYDAQVRLIKSKTNISVNSVDGFQGNEKDIIIISTVRSNKKNIIGFLKDYRRMNVALTRAKKKLIIIGNSNTLNDDKYYHNLIKHCKLNNSYFLYY